MTEGSVWHPGAGLLVLQSPWVEQTKCMRDGVFLRKGYCGRGSKKKKKKRDDGRTAYVSKFPEYCLFTLQVSGGSSEGVVQAWWRLCRAVGRQLLCAGCRLDEGWLADVDTRHSLTLLVAVRHDGCSTFCSKAPLVPSLPPGCLWVPFVYLLVTPSWCLLGAPLCAS